MMGEAAHELVSIHDIVRGRQPSRETILELERAILAQPQTVLPVKHHFSPGIYARELFIPAGTVLTGKIHKHAHLCMISQGAISVLTEHGVQLLRAPCTFLSTPGVKRAGYAHEDTVFTTIHATTETDIEKIEQMVTADSFEEFDKLQQQEAIKAIAGVVS
jgi:hypothetical protein